MAMFAFSLIVFWIADNCLLEIPYLIGILRIKHGNGRRGWLFFGIFLRALYAYGSITRVMRNPAAWDPIFDDGSLVFAVILTIVFYKSTSKAIYQRDSSPIVKVDDKNTI